VDSLRGITSKDAFKLKPLSPEIQLRLGWISDLFHIPIGLKKSCGKKTICLNSE